MSQDFFLKYILVGNTSVGKSAILHRFIKNNFKSDTIATVGVDYRARNINVADKVIGLMVWDTAGMETFRSFTQNYYRSSAVAVFIYDITKRDSYLAVQEWIDVVRRNTMDNPQLILVIVGNKCDLNAERTVDFSEGEELAKTNDAIFLEASAATGNGVDEIFKKGAESFYGKYKDGLIDITNESHGFLLGPKQLELASHGGEHNSCSC